MASDDVLFYGVELVMAMALAALGIAMFRWPDIGRLVTPNPDRRLAQAVLCVCASCWMFALLVGVFVYRSLKP